MAARPSRRADARAVVSLVVPHHLRAVTIPHVGVADRGARASIEEVGVGDARFPQWVKHNLRDRATGRVMDILLRAEVALTKCAAAERSGCFLLLAKSREETMGVDAQI